MSLIFSVAPAVSRDAVVVVSDPEVWVFVVMVAVVVVVIVAVAVVTGVFVSPGFFVFFSSSPISPESVGWGR